MSWELSDEHEQFRKGCRTFVDRKVRPLVDASEADGTFPAELWADLGSADLLGLVTPEEHGGSAADATAVALLAEELSRASGGIAVTALVSAYMAAPHIVRNGTAEQQARWLRPLADGSAVASIAVTEPGTGSDVARVTTRARRQGDDYVIDGRKMYITNAGIADVVVVGARTGDEGRAGVTLFLVETTSPGFSVGRPLRKMGWHSSDTREVVLDEVVVPASAVLGVENRGFYQIMEAFQLERIALAGMAIGHAAECLQLSLDHVRQREAFGAPLVQLQTIRHRLATMDIELQAARVITYQAAARLDAGHPEAGRSVAQAKYLSAQACNRIVDDAVQLFGGAGFVEESAVARHFRDARILRIGGGTDEIQLEILTRGMAA